MYYDVFKDGVPHFCKIENEVAFDSTPLDLHKTVIEYRLLPRVICENTYQICPYCTIILRAWPCQRPRVPQAACLAVNIMVQYGNIATSFSILQKCGAPTLIMH